MIHPRGETGRWANRFHLMAALLAAAMLSACASHHQDLLDVRASLTSGNVPAAVEAFEKRKQKNSDLLYLLERGYMLHLAGRWQESNDAFQLAETRAEDLYTKSISRAVASLVTNDMALPYKSTPHELQFIQYYRALNYLALGAPDEALVEARKANLYLSQYAAQTEGQEKFRQDAFLQYFTGLLYESRGESNDAVVSMRDAWARYDEYKTAYGQGAPSWLAPDYYAAAEYVGLPDDLDLLRAHDSTLAAQAAQGTGNNTVVYFECGFVPYRESVRITLPIFREQSADQLAAAQRYVTTYSDDLYAYDARKVKLDHVLSFSFPELIQVPCSVTSCKLVLASGEELEAEPALNLTAIATADFKRRMPAILLKTIARAIAKEALRKEAKKEDETFGWIVNTINVATEQADTRGWILLPGQIYMLKTQLPPGSQVLTARFFSSGGQLLEEVQKTVDVSASQVSFSTFRSFR